MAKCQHQIWESKSKKYRNCKKKPKDNGFCCIHTPKITKQITIDELTQTFASLDIPQDEKWADAPAKTESGNYSMTGIHQTDSRWDFIQKHLNENYTENFSPLKNKLELLSVEHRQHPIELYNYNSGLRLFDILGKDTTERWGMHGVQWDNLIPLINEQGIKVQANQLNFFCRGAYLSVRSEFSVARGFTARFSLKKGKFVPDTNGNIHHMYMCKFYTGRYCVGEKNILLPPLLNKASAERFDSVTNSMDAPTIFALPDNNMLRIVYSLMVRVT